MKNYVSFNAKYYKNSNASGEIGHVQRVFATNTNQIVEFAKDNFGCGYNIYDRYKEVFDQVESIKGKKIQKNSNTFMDGVLSFSRDHMLEIMKDPDWKTSFSNHINDFMQDVKKQTGMEPLGWEMHMDEGHKDPVTGEYKLNYHAQCIFFNYDFKTNKAPLRDLMGRKGDSIWSKLQDTAGKRFEDLGFVRGVSADMTKAKHDEKDDFIASKQAEIERLQAELAQRQIQQERALKANQELLEEAAAATDEILAECNEAIDILNKREEKKVAENELRETIKNNIDQFTEKFNQSSKLRSYVESFSQSFPVFTEALKTTYKRLVEFFNIDDSGDPLSTLKMTKENIAKVKDINDGLKRKFKI
jgi:EAL domain-containing protein (putative c-di-GMP-specific phosphodiesterase class I)